MSRWCQVLLAAAVLAPLVAGPAQARHRAGVEGDASGVSSGSPPVELRHIFQGEINRRGKAVGFHSRPGGVNPPTISGTSDPRPVRGHPGLYNLFRFQITQDGRTETKGISTLYPDKCSAADVVAAIRHAFNTGQSHGPQFRGMSGPTCTDNDGQEFPITGFTGGRGELRIRTGFPDMGGGRQ